MHTFLSAALWALLFPLAAAFLNKPVSSVCRSPIPHAIDTAASACKDPVSETDFRIIMARAIAVSTAFDLSTDEWTEGSQLSLNVNTQSKRLQAIMNQLSKATGGFKIKTYPKTIKIKYKDCAYSDIEWEVEALGDRLYSVVYNYCVDGDYSINGTISIYFDMNEDAYDSYFEISKIGVKNEEEVLTTCKITLSQNRVISFVKKTEPYE